MDSETKLRAMAALAENMYKYGEINQYAQLCILLRDKSLLTDTEFFGSIQLLKVVSTLHDARNYDKSDNQTEEVKSEGSYDLLDEICKDLRQRFMNSLNLNCDCYNKHNKQQ